SGTFRPRPLAVAARHAASAPRSALRQLTRAFLRHGFDQGPEDGIDGFSCRKNGGNVRIEDHGTTASLEPSRETVRLCFAVVKTVLRQHVLVRLRYVVTLAG